MARFSKIETLSAIVSTGIVPVFYHQCPQTAKDVLKAWKKPGDKTKYAKFYANDSNWGNDNYNRRATNTFTYKGDYLCLREITLQYSLPSKLFTKVGLKGVTLTVSGNNLYYFTEVKGISPEMGSSTTYDGSVF